MIVFLVQSVNYIENYYRTENVEKLFVSRELAEKWIERQLTREVRLRAERARADEITQEWNSANPFKFDEVRPAVPPKWPSGMRKASIISEMRAVRDEQKKLERENFTRYGDAQTERHVRMEAHLVAVWAAEGRTGDVTKRPYVPTEPSEYNITEMPVCETADIEEGDDA